MIFPGRSGFRPPLLNDRLFISESILQDRKTRIKERKKENNGMPINYINVLVDGSIIINHKY